MPDDRLVVSNTSPVLNLAFIDRLDLLEMQFSVLTVPQQVWEEITAGEAGVDAHEAIRNEGIITVVPAERTSLFVELLDELDRGEAAAICYAIQEDADLLLIDEADGRRVARRHDIPVTGVIGILLRAAKAGAIDLETELDALRDVGFWFSDDLRAKILDAADEA